MRGGRQQPACAGTSYSTLPGALSRTPRLTPPTHTPFPAARRRAPAGQSAPAPNRFKGEDFTSMFVLEFGADGAVQNISWQDAVQIAV